MYKQTVFLEENAFGAVRPFAVATDVPVATLIPKLVTELNLPQTDLFGKKLVYMLRLAGGGRVIPEQSTLRAAGIQEGARLVLDSYVLDGSVAALEQQKPGSAYGAPSLHSSDTVADSGPLVPVGAPAPGGGRNAPVLTLPALKLASPTMPVPTDARPPQEPLPVPTIARPSRKWDRRRFLLTGGLILGLSGAGLGYAAYAQFTRKNSMAGNPARMTTGFTTQQQPTIAPTPTPTPTKAAPMFPTTAQSQLTFSSHKQTVRALAWSPTGTMLASGGDDARLLLWNETGAILHDIGHAASVRALAWSPDGQRLVTGANVQVTFINAQTGAVLARPTPRHTQVITSLTWTVQQQSRVVSASADTHAVVWNTTTYRSLRTYALHTVGIEAVASSGDGHTVATGSQGGFVRIWDTETGVDLHNPYQDAKKPMHALAFTPQGFQLAVGGDDGIVRIWNVGTCMTNGNKFCMDAPQRLQVSQNPIRTLAWSPDARMLAVGADDGITSLWAPGVNQKPLLTIQQNKAVHSLSWSPDGGQLATAAGNTVTIWKLV